LDLPFGEIEVLVMDSICKITASLMPRFYITVQTNRASAARATTPVQKSQADHPAIRLTWRDTTRTESLADNDRQSLMRLPVKPNSPFAGQL
jgi:hypothetical protein